MRRGRQIHVCLTVSIGQARRVVPFGVSAAGVSNARVGSGQSLRTFFVFWPRHVPAAGERLWGSTGATQGE